MPMRRRGFTLIEVIVALAIMITLAAVVVPSVVSSLDRARVDRAQESLQGIADAITAFQGDVNTYPASLTQLIVAVQNQDPDICGNGIQNKDARNWTGPYLHRVLASGGLPVGIGTANNAFSVVAATNMAISVTGVELADAEALDDRVDGDGTQSSGTVQWSAPDADNFVTLYWVVPFSGC
ncbi:MAG TPA: prepilin-type N-terminal cleavage/methylation domain-containing protein [Longimicrobiales bacterium]|nr:prepilin-type N-terminal cleavage/methylation domain-containing protein [Longimicrobiales bacterium]